MKICPAHGVCKVQSIIAVIGHLEGKNMYRQQLVRPGARRAGALDHKLSPARALFEPLERRLMFTVMIDGFDELLTSSGREGLLEGIVVPSKTPYIRPAGSIDFTFGEGGNVMRDFGGVESAGGVAIQSDGKIVVAALTGGSLHHGYTWVYDQLLLVRYNADGSLDSTFGDNGTVRVSVHEQSLGYRTPVLIQPNGKILVGTRDYLHRFNADGSIDASFGNAGAVNIGNSTVSAIALQTGGRILISCGSSFQPLVMAFLEDGKLDTSFGNNGAFSLPASPENWIRVTDMHVQSDGKIVVAGHQRVTPHDTYRTEGLIIRLDASGSLDGTFGDGGIVRVRHADRRYNDLASLVILDDGRIIAAGEGNTHRNESGALLVALNSDGSFDHSFGEKGMVFHTGYSVPYQINRLAVGKDGKVIAASYGLQMAMELTRFNLDGSIDRSFGLNGRCLVAGNGMREPNAVDLAVDADGNIVVVGRLEIENFGFYRDEMIARSDILIGRVTGEPITEEIEDGGEFAINPVETPRPNIDPVVDAEATLPRYIGMGSMRPLSPFASTPLLANDTSDGVFGEDDRPEADGSLLE